MKLDRIFLACNYIRCSFNFCRKKLGKMTSVLSDLVNTEDLLKTDLIRLIFLLISHLKIFGTIQLAVVFDFDLYQLVN